jgi:fermentation-respiration switch protein FrsA (DUF1100 family)
MIVLWVLAILTVVLLALGLVFAVKVVYPKTFAVEETYRIEVEKGYLKPEVFEKLPQQRVKIRSRYGYDLFAIYFPIEGSKKTVVIAHGITYTLYGMTKYMDSYRQRGFNVLLYDHRNHGRSGGRNSTFGYYEKWDLQTVVDWAREQLGEGGAVGVMGESFGAATALQQAALDDRLAFVVSDCAFSDLDQLLVFRLRQDFGLPAFPVLWLARLWIWLLTGMKVREAAPLRVVGQIVAPVLFVHGAGDTYIPPAMAQALYQAKAQGVRRLYLASGADHAMSVVVDPVEYDRVVGAFLEEIGF